jgi:hypothetical protein
MTFYYIREKRDGAVKVARARARGSSVLERRGYCGNANTIRETQWRKTAFVSLKMAAEYRRPGLGPRGRGRGRGRSRVESNDRDNCAKDDGYLTGAHVETCTAIAATPTRRAENRFT